MSLMYSEREGLYSEGNIAAENQMSSSYLPLDRAVPSSVLGHRRHAFSGVNLIDPPFISAPRMMRRGAVSYDETDSTAQYIRFLGTGSSTLIHLPPFDNVLTLCLLSQGMQ